MGGITVAEQPQDELQRKPGRGEGMAKTHAQQKPQVGRKAVQTEGRMGQGREKDSPALEVGGVSRGSGGTEIS